MYWPRTEECSASFDQLFANPWPVHSIDSDDPILRTFPAIVPGRVPNLRMDRSAVIRIEQFGLIAGIYDDHAEVHARTKQLMNQLTLIEPLQAAVDDFRRRHFSDSGCKVIGVHVRFGDLYGDHITLEDACVPVFAAVDHFLTVCPSARILLCSDDGAVRPNGIATPQRGVHDTFERKYGDRVVYTIPRTLDRREPSAIQDAVVDLFLLRSADFIVGTKKSTYSLMSHFGMRTPRRMVHYLSTEPTSVTRDEMQPHGIRSVAARFARRLRRTLGRFVR